MGGIASRPHFSLGVLRETCHRDRAGRGIVG